MCKKDVVENDDHTTKPDYPIRYAAALPKQAEKDSIFCVVEEDNKEIWHLAGITWVSPESDSIKYKIDEFQFPRERLQV